MESIKVGLLGLGVVGGGTWKVLARNAREIARRAGRNIEVTRVAVRDVAKARKLLGPDVAVGADPFEVVRDPSIDIVIELIGGYGIAKALVLEAIAAGKHVVTANKALLAVHGTGPDNVFVVGTQGTVLHFDGATWTRESLDFNLPRPLRGVWAFADGGALAVGRGLDLYRRRATGVWASQNTTFGPMDFNDVAQLGDRALAVGDYAPLAGLTGAARQAKVDQLCTAEAERTLRGVREDIQRKLDQKLAREQLQPGRAE